MPSSRVRCSTCIRRRCGSRCSGPPIGNHDGTSADLAWDTGPYYDIFSLPKAAQAGGLASGTEAYYSFDYGDIHFICLDSFETSRATGGAMLTWLQNDLASTNQKWIIAF